MSEHPDTLFECPKCNGWHFNFSVSGVLICASVTRHTDFKVKEGGCGWKGVPKLSNAPLSKRPLRPMKWKRLRRLRCFFTSHRYRMYHDLVRVSADRVECPCCRCGKLGVAEYGLVLNGTHDWSREA